MKARTNQLKVYRSQFLVTANLEQEIIEDAFLAVEGTKIKEVGSWKKRPRAKQALTDFSYGLIAPTLSNLHAHLPMVLFRGIAEDQDLHEWLTKTIFPLEAKFLNPAFVRLGSELALCESIRNGVTFFCNMYLFGGEVAKVADEFGVRGVFCQDASNFNSPDFRKWSDALSAAKKLIRQYKNHPRIQGGVSPHSPYGADLDVLKACAQLMKEENAGGMIHIAETKRELDEAKKNFGCSPFQQAAKSGIFDSRFLVIAHGVWPEENDFALLRRKNLSIALNVQCNAKLASGVPPIARYKKENIRICLGTDGAASNNNLDIFEEMNFIGKIHHLITGDLTGLTCNEIFSSATRNAAEAFGLQASLGSLEAGKEADFMVVDLRHAHLNPVTNPMSHLVYSTRGPDVDSVFVAGKALMKNRKILVANEQKIIARANQIWKKMKSSLEN